jgi:hypothetical protein
MRKKGDFFFGGGEKKRGWGGDAISKNNAKSIKCGN